jgi:hypothetical protein
MARIIVSTNHREVLHDSISGWLYVIDLESRQILQRTSGIEPPHRSVDENPRGGMRGMRGISIRNGELAVANYSSVLVFDRNWNLLRTCTHPSVSAIHEILYVEDGIWVTSTANDLLAKFDASGALKEYYLIQAQKKLMQVLQISRKRILNDEAVRYGEIDFRKRSYFNSDSHDRTHLNSVSFVGNDGLWLSLGLIVGNRFLFLMAVKTLMLKLKIWGFFLALNRMLRKTLKTKKQLHSDLVVRPAKGKSAVVKFNESAWDVVLQFETAQNPSHSVRILKDGTGVYLDTSNGDLINFNKQGDILFRTKITDRFLRGILELPNGQICIGAGSTLLFFDREAGKVVDQIKLSSESLNTVFDIQLLPSEFDVPPASLTSKTGRMIGFEGQKIIWE